MADTALEEGDLISDLKAKQLYQSLVPEEKVGAMTGAMDTLLQRQRPESGDGLRRPIEWVLSLSSQMHTPSAAIATGQSRQNSG